MGRLIMISFIVESTLCVRYGLNNSYDCKILRLLAPIKLAIEQSVHMSYYGPMATSATPDAW